MGDMADMCMWDERDLCGDDDEPLAPAHVTCRCCGKTGLEWGMDKGKWRLFDSHGMHRCKAKPLPVPPKPRVITDPIEKAFYAGYEAGYEACGAQAWPEVGINILTTKREDYEKYRKTI